MFLCVFVQVSLWELFASSTVRFTIRRTFFSRCRAIERFCQLPYRILSEYSGTWSWKHPSTAAIEGSSRFLTNALNISSKISTRNRGYRIRTIHYDLMEHCGFANRLSLVPKLVNCFGGNFQALNLIGGTSLATWISKIFCQFFLNRLICINYFPRLLEDIFVTNDSENLMFFPEHFQPVVFFLHIIYVRFLTYGRLENRPICKIFGKILHMELRNSARHLKYLRKSLLKRWFFKGKIKCMTHKSPNFPPAAGNQYFY